MSTQTTELPLGQYHAASKYHIEKVSASEPFKWLSKGFSSFKRIPGLSILYGVIFAVVVAGAYQLMNNLPWYSLAYLTGIVVLGPVLASGLYAASRDIDQGKKPSIMSSLYQIRERKTYLALFSLMLALVMAAWVRFSALLFAIKFSTVSPTIESYTNLFASSEGLVTLLFFIGIGFLLVSAVFVLSAIAVPLILDKDVDFITAMQTSYYAVSNNKSAMAVWALIIAALTAFGIATAFVGLVIVFPVLGYATWESYKSMVK